MACHHCRRATLKIEFIDHISTSFFTNVATHGIIAETLRTTNSAGGGNPRRCLRLRSILVNHLPRRFNGVLLAKVARMVWHLGITCIDHRTSRVQFSPERRLPIQQ
jgi:hypothetical protein